MLAINLRVLLVQLRTVRYYDTWDEILLQPSIDPLHLFVFPTQDVNIKQKRMLSILCLNNLDASLKQLESG